MANKSPEHLAETKRLQDKARKAGSRQFGDVKKQRSKSNGDPIARIAKEADKSPKRMFKESMGHLKSLMPKDEKMDKGDKKKKKKK